jgi:hypothetical protein
MASNRLPTEHEHHQLLKDYYHVFNTLEGQRVLNDMRSVFGGSSARGTAHETAIRAGEQNVLEHIDLRLSFAENRQANELAGMEVGP